MERLKSPATFEKWILKIEIKMKNRLDSQTDGKVEVIYYLRNVYS